jgi:aspartate racemase
MGRTTKTVGILGGMGPYATAAFYQTLTEITPATRDWDHLRVIIDSNPHIPSRSRHHLYHEDSPVPGMIESCKRLETYPVDFIVIPCNSAAYFIKDVQPVISIPILNIMGITADALAHKVSPGGSVGVLGGVITYDCRTYEEFLKSKGFLYFHHSPSSQRKVESLIEQIKVNTRAEAVAFGFSGLVQEILSEQAVDALILGCTEFGCLSGLEGPVPLVDSSLELARKTVELALKP